MDNNISIKCRNCGGKYIGTVITEMKSINLVLNIERFISSLKVKCMMSFLFEFDEKI